jgi:cell division protease FtsH
MKLSKLAKKRIKTVLLCMIPVLIACWCLKDSVTNFLETPPLSDYSLFAEYLKEGKVDIVYYPSDNNEFRYCLFNEETAEMSVSLREDYQYPKDEYMRTYYPKDNEEFLSYLVSKDVRIEESDFEPVSVVIIDALTLLLIYVVLIMVALYFLKMSVLDRVEIEPDYSTQTKFTDVIGHEEVIDDLKFYVELLNGKIKDKTVTMPKGVLLSGPPGTGKTLLARAVAGEASCPFFSVNSSEIIDMYVGKGAKNIRYAFKTAKKNAPCVLFIDEIDAIGGSRNRTEQKSSEDRQTLNALLQEMDGFTKNNGVLVIAATNDPDYLDPALKRSGRFDREVKILPPHDINTITNLYKYYLSKKRLSDDGIDYDMISRQSSGLTGADIANICNEAGLINLASHGNGITTDIITTAIEKFIVKGSPSKKEPNRLENKIVRYHEAGHAVMNYLQGIDIQKITVIPTTSGAGGYVLTDSPINALHITKDSLEKQIRALYGGRMSEEIKFGEEYVTLGSSNDLTEASKLIKSYIMEYSYSNTYVYLDVNVFSAQATSGLLSSAKGIAERLRKETFDMLNENYFLVEALANKLVESPILSGYEVKSLLDHSRQKRLDKQARIEKHELSQKSISNKL